MTIGRFFGLGATFVVLGFGLLSIWAASQGHSFTPEGVTLSAQAGVVLVLGGIVVFFMSRRWGGPRI